MLAGMTASFAELDALTTEELRERAFATAREHRDLGFFWSVLKHLPDSDDAATLDGAPNSVGPTVDEAVALWRELTGHGYGEQEPLLRAAFIDYLQKH
jgi:DNA-binding transcriptional regulator YbjK